MPIYGIIGIYRELLAHNLAKSQYFSSLIDYYQYLQVLAKYLKKCEFIAKKPQQFHKISHISVCAFCPVAVTKKSSHPTFLNIFADNFEYSPSTKFGS